MNEPVERDGVQSWVARMPFVRTLTVSEIAPVHHAAIRRIRRLTWVGSATFVGFMSSVVALLVRAGAFERGGATLVFPLLGFAALFGHVLGAEMKLYGGWKLVRLTWRGGPVPTIDRYVGTPDPREFDRTYRLTQPAFAQHKHSSSGRSFEVDVLRDLALVLSVNGAVPRVITGCRVHVTSNRLEGTQKGVERELAPHELMELGDLSRHDRMPLWSGVVFATLLIAPGLEKPELVPMVLGTVVGGVVVLVACLDWRVARQRQRLFTEILRHPRIVGGRRKNGQAVEVLMPGKVLWTEGDQPAPDRFRKHARSLQRYLDTGEYGTGRPTSF